MLQEIRVEEKDYDEYLESTLQFCRQANSELNKIEDQIIKQDRAQLFKYWNLD